MSANNNQLEIDAEKIVPVVPHHFGRNDAIPADLIGATIIAIGTTDLRDGCLVIDYRPHGSTDTVRIEFGFGDEGMWLMPPTA